MIESVIIFSQEVLGKNGMVLKKRARDGSGPEDWKERGIFCEAAWDSFLCWPPVAAGETLLRPCPLLDTMGTIIGENPHPVINPSIIQWRDKIGQESKIVYSSGFQPMGRGPLVGLG
ncbi:hypothetical protein AVEN_153548-1 [Araneus ventricosus]|uniref:G-protein coupled receptors family 2 profile 1 domain-containing protein n=1 Tax=Araneus ventricosus TaxID=182803 RepID=A0A4Y2G615_ARAVE|nr:hypothetical protein AVEN_153548-1 [Araneus ventricosus]